MQRPGRKRELRMSCKEGKRPAVATAQLGDGKEEAFFLGPPELQRLLLSGTD